ncbi:MAG: ABC transporter permease [Saprospiraceae bacterium]|nr:ABC transporter permease [Saprospiraceae bacterium]
MFRHSVKLALRNFRRHKSTFLINLIGLSTGLACALLILLWVSDELKIDRFHAKDERLFQVMEYQHYADNIMATRSTPGLLAETLAEEIPDIEHAATTEWGDTYTLSHGDHNLTAEGLHVGHDFFHLFSYPLLHGTPDDVLADPANIVLSESTAIALFGSSSAALGQMVEFQHASSLLVSGVYEDFPPYSTLQFDFLLTWEKYKSENSWVLSWGSNGPNTIVTLREGADAATVERKIADFVKQRNEGSHVTLFLKKFSDLYLRGRFENGKPAGGRIEYVRLFTLIAVFILGIACINFMNLATARASRRAREVGVKKTIGASKSALARQFLLESLLTALFSLVTAVVIARLILPHFNLLTGKELTIAPSWQLAGMFLGLTAMTGLIAGSYPALYLSRLKPAAVLKGEMRGSAGELLVRRGLVIFQFILSAILIVSVLVVYKQLQYVQSKNLGYDKEHLVYFNIEGQLEDRYDTFVEQAMRLRGVVEATTIGHDLIGRQNNTHGLQWPGKHPESRILFENVAVNYNALNTLGINLTRGRDFSREFGGDTANVIFNERGIEVMGLADPIGQTVRLWDRYDLRIVGVVENFHFQSLHEEIRPLFFRLSPANTWYVMVRLADGQVQEGLKNLQELYESFNPGFAFNPDFVDEEYTLQYAAEQRVSALSRYFAGLAIIISCLGLLGLAMFTAERRKKEIGIRKILGATILNIVTMLTRDFSKLVLISIVIALPLAFLALSSWLQRFVYSIDLSPWLFVYAGAAVLVIAWLTVASQALKSARVHPQECLKVE